MTFWPSAWLIVMALGVGGFAIVSILIAVKGFSEIKAILRKLQRESDERRSPEP